MNRGRIRKSRPGGDTGKPAVTAPARSSAGVVESGPTSDVSPDDTRRAQPTAGPSGMAKSKLGDLRGKKQNREMRQQFTLREA